MNLLKEKKSLRVQSLIEQMPAAPATIRRDISSLEAGGLIYRTRGEIHLSESDRSIVLPAIARGGLHASEKARIARYAAGLISNNMNIILDSGSTTAALAQKLTDRKVTVVTNSLDVSSILSKSNVNVICCGGMLQGDHMCFVGPDAQAFFSKIEVDIAFLGASGVRSTAGFTTSSPLQYDVKRAIVAAARKRYVLLDTSKLHSSHLYVFAGLKDFDAVITNTPDSGSVEEAMLSQLSDAGANIVCVP